MIKRVLLSLCLVLPAALTAPALADNVLNIGVQLEPPNLDPTKGAAAAIDEIVYANVFEGLTGIAADGTVVPRLAERWQIFDDGRRYRFFLRQNVRFHDGTPFDAEDLKFSLERAASDSANAQQVLFEAIARIVIINTHTVDVIMKRVVGLFLHHLAWGDAVMVARESADSNATHPVGTGPFRFARWYKGVSIDLVRNDMYWGEPVALDGVSFRIIPDPTVAFASLMAGDLDGFPGYPAPENIEQFRSSDRFDVVVGTTEGETILAINNQLAPFDDIRIRRALSHAIDKQAVIQGAMFGYGQAIGSHFPPHHPSYIDLSERYPYSVARAKALLAEAGYADGMKATLKLPPPSYARRAGEIVAAQLGAIGVEISIENLEWAQWLGQVVANRNYELTIVAHTEPFDLDIYARDGYYFQYESPEYRQLITELSATIEPTKRHMLYQRAQQKLSDDAVNVFLFQLPKLAVWAQGVEGTWKNAPVQANDVTAVKRTGRVSARAAQGKGWLLHATAFIVGGIFLFGSGYLAYQAGLNFILKRMTSMLLTMLIATIIIFGLVEIAPGDPAEFMMGLNAEPEALQALRAELGLDKPVLARYLAWVGGLVTGDFGISYTYRTPVAELITTRLQVSLPLALYAIILTIVIAIPAGMMAARRYGRLSGDAIMGITQMGIAMPNFWIAILLILTLAGGLRWFPVGGFPGWEAGIFPALQALTLPAIALAVPQAAILVRVVRSALLDTMAEDYIRTARAKGLTQTEALKHHALRNAAIPVLTILGLQFSFLLAGGIIIENVFYLPGLGRLVFQAILQRDLIVVESVVFLLVFATVGIAFIVDLAYAAVDPRLRKGA